MFYLSICCQALSAGVKYSLKLAIDGIIRIFMFVFFNVFGHKFLQFLQNLENQTRGGTNTHQDTSGTQGLGRVGLVF